MTIDQFRSHDALPSLWARELENNATLQTVLAVLDEAHPDRFPVHTDLHDDISPTKATLLLGETRGYSKVLNTIRALAKPKLKPIDLGETVYAKEKT